jgi:hypothetical protein
MLKSRFDSEEVIAAGHPPVAKGIVCVDFDGTIFPFGDFAASSPPIPGVPEAMDRLREAGYTILIFSSRLSAAWHAHEGWDHEEAVREHVEYMKSALDREEIPYDGFASEKIPAQAYFDDKAWRAEGDYGLLNAVGQFLGDEEGM